MRLPSLEVIVTAHKEGALLYATMRSAQVAVEALQQQYSVDVGITLFLDKTDEVTRLIGQELEVEYDLSLVEGSNGDPGQARLEAITSTKRDMIALLDGDVLWSENWLLKCYQELDNLGGRAKMESVIFHPEYNLIFGAHNMLVRQGQPADPFFDKEFLRIGNYWDALCFASRKVFSKFPYLKNDVESGHAHEDFAWSCETYLSGLEHRCLKNAVHFKRRRGGSVSVIADSKKVKPVLSSVSFY